MHEKPLPRSPRSFATFIVLDLAIEAIEVLRPIVAGIRRCDRDLGEQLRRALSSVARSAFYIEQFDCNNQVLANAISRYGFDYRTQ
jgi:hypothetical protein